MWPRDQELYFELYFLEKAYTLRIYLRCNDYKCRIKTS